MALQYGGVALLVLGLLAWGPHALAQKATFRKGTTDSSFVVRYQDSVSVEYPEGSTIDYDSDYGWGFRFGYNYTSKLNLSVQIDMMSVPYTARLQPADDSSATEVVRYKSDQYSAMFKGDYHFSVGRLTPYIEGGMGWVAIDSNIATGNSASGCWWSPWGPVVCDTWHYSYTDTSFSYELGVGLRYEPDTRTFVRASISRQWLDADFATNSPGYYTAQIEIGAMVWD